MFGNKNSDFSPPIISPQKESSLFELVRFLIISAIIVVLFRIYIAQPFIVSGTSMSPTFETGQYLIIDEVSYRFEEPRRGDVIILKKPTESGEYLIKRVIGLPKEVVEIENGKLKIKNGENKEGLYLDETYVVNEKKENYKIELGENEYFVMGDNRPLSLDSRYIGPIPRENIIGHAVLRLFPFSKIGLFPGAI